MKLLKTDVRMSFRVNTIKKFNGKESKDFSTHTTKSLQENKLRKN